MTGQLLGLIDGPASGIKLVPGGSMAAIDQLVTDTRSRAIYERFKDLRVRPVETEIADLEANLFNTLSDFKIYISQVSMHLEDSWRHRLFDMLDDLYDATSWDSDDPLTPLASFQTFVRLMLITKPDRFPGVGVTGDKGFAAAWYLGPDRLTIFSYPADRVRFSLSIHEGETANGSTTIQNFLSRLESYDPSRWFAI